MSRRTATAAILASLALAATGCLGPSEVTTTPKKTAGRDAGPTGDAKPKAKPTKPKAAHVGDTLALNGFKDGEQADVTVKKFIDPAESADQYFKAESGKKWVAAQFEIVNTGSAAYDDSPTNGAQVADADGQRFSTTFGEVTAGPSMASTVKLAKGDKALGWVVFEVPRTSKITTVQFAMNSGFASKTGQWFVR